MFDIVNAWLKAAPKVNDAVRKPFVCADGYTLSIQASKYHYCSPRDDADHYTMVEVWGTKRDGKHTTSDPEGWVPVDALAKRIKRHGGPSRQTMELLNEQQVRQANG